MKNNSENKHHIIERNYLFATSSFILIIHLTQVLNFKFQNFILLSFLNIACVISILIFNYLFQKNKNLRTTIDQIIVCESLNIFFSSIFIWKTFPEVFIWAACVFLAILLFYEGQKLLNYIAFTSILFVSAPLISEILSLDDYFNSKALKIDKHYKEFLYVTIIAATILLVFIVAGFKKYLYLNSEYYNHPSNEYQNTDFDFTEKTANKGSGDLEQLFIKIKNHIETEKKYLDPDFSLRTLSIEIGSNISYVSKSINTYSSYNFSDFINKYRIEYFKFLLKNEDNFSAIKKHYVKCGFKQQSTFNRVFKQLEGTTPTQYLKNKT